MSSHRIILLNFTEKETNAVAKAGYNVERGIIGSPDPGKTFCPCWTPHPFYEYDVLFYNSRLDRGVPDLRSGLPDLHNLFTEKGTFRALATFQSSPKVRVAFLGGDTGMDTLVLGGISFAEVVKAERNISTFVEHNGFTFSIDEVKKLISGLKTQIAGVEQFYRIPNNNYPFNHEVVLSSRGGGYVAGYGTTYEDRTYPRYIILPQLTDFPRGIIEILRCLESVWPELFPDKIQQDWINGSEFLLPEERAIETEIHG